MLSRVAAWFLLGATALTLGLGCKARERAEQDSRPLPSPEPPAAPPSVSREEAAPTPKKRTDEEVKDSTKAKRPVAEASGRPAPAASGVTAVGGAAAAAPVGTPAASASPLPSVPVFTAPSAACLARCQGAMQGCLSAPVDGGVPGFGNLELCKKAFEACQAACK